MRGYMTSMTCLKAMVRRMIVHAKRNSVRNCRSCSTGIFDVIAENVAVPAAKTLKVHAPLVSASFICSLR